MADTNTTLQGRNRSPSAHGGFPIVRVSGRCGWLLEVTGSGFDPRTPMVTGSFLVSLVFFPTERVCVPDCIRHPEYLFPRYYLRTFFFFNFRFLSFQVGDNPSEPGTGHVYHGVLGSSCRQRSASTINTYISLVVFRPVSRLSTVTYI